MYILLYILYFVLGGSRTTDRFQSLWWPLPGFGRSERCQSLPGPRIGQVQTSHQSGIARRQRNAEGTYFMGFG